jgi:CheY-like chemotaxis protein
VFFSSVSLVKRDGASFRGGPVFCVWASGTAKSGVVRKKMSYASSQVLFLGELPFWLKISQSIVEAPAAPFQVHRSPSLRDALRRLDAEQWQALLLDLSHPSAQELLAARKLHDGLAAIPVVALLPIRDPQFQTAASAAGASSSLLLNDVTSASLQHAVVTAINGNTLRSTYRKGTTMTLPLESAPAIGLDRLPPSKIDAISHALNNLLCVINANADILTDQLDSTHNAARSVSQIKKATKSAADLMRLLKTP